MGFYPDDFSGMDALDFLYSVLWKEKFHPTMASEAKGRYKMGPIGRSFWANPNTFVYFSFRYPFYLANLATLDSIGFTKSLD